MSNDSLNIRLDSDLKASFSIACKSNDTTASQALRSYIRDYVLKNGQTDLFNGSAKPKKNPKN